MPALPRLATQSIAGGRPYQEDTVLARTLPDGRVLVAVADGMGGHAAGEVASALAIETLEGAVLGGAPLDRAVRLANRRVWEGGQVPGRRGMGTTLVALLLGTDGHYQVANVGDSRAYLLSGGTIRRITEDHSYLEEAIRSGYPRDVALAPSWRNALTRALGVEPSVEVDLFGPFPAEPATVVLLCSDGLYKSLDDDALARIHGQQAADPQAAADTLVKASLDAGSDDNISVALVDFGAAGASAGAGGDG